MNFVIEFYRGLDPLNLIIFWGVIIVVILLLIFSIIMASKNRKLKELLELKEEQNNEGDVPIVNEPVIIQNEIKEDEPEEIIENNTKEEFFSVPSPVEEEKQFIAEEHVMPYQEHEIEEVTEKQTEPIAKRETYYEEEPKRVPYQKNVLKDMPRITSPIGIVNSNIREKEMDNATELQQVLNTETEEKNDNYLTEVRDKLARATSNDGINRTDYELKQEEEAIISYNELLKKKDDIKIVDEEEAVISIEELINRTNEKLYNLTEEEENDKFIKELKNFRSDL